MVVASHEGQLVEVVFPRRDADAPGGWAWAEVAVCQSSIDGYGLATRQSDSLDWSSLGDKAVYLPLLGRETELCSADESQVCERVLQGGFVPFAFREMHPPPSGSTWATNGLYVSLVQATATPAGWRPIGPHEVLLQVCMNAVTRRGDGDSCVYLLKDAALRLLHIPQHVFDVLAMHHKRQHNDRHFATHAVSYRRERSTYMLINAHPIFGDAAFAGGCVNEPLAGEEPNMELVLAKLQVHPRFEQPDPRAFDEWCTFSGEFPEVLERHIYFTTCNESYEPGEELLASYGSGYLRAYSSHGFEQPPPTVRIPPDCFAESDLDAALWPLRVPAWWNPSMQPVERPALAALAGPAGDVYFEVAADDPHHVLARSLLPPRQVHSKRQPPKTMPAKRQRAGRRNARSPRVGRSASRMADRMPSPDEKRVSSPVLVRSGLASAGTPPPSPLAEQNAARPGVEIVPPLTV